MSRLFQCVLILQKLFFSYGNIYSYFNICLYMLFVMSPTLNDHSLLSQYPISSSLRGSYPYHPYQILAQKSRHLQFVLMFFTCSYLIHSSCHIFSWEHCKNNQMSDFDHSKRCWKLVFWADLVGLFGALKAFCHSSITLANCFHLDKVVTSIRSWFGVVYFDSCGFKNITNRCFTRAFFRLLMSTCSNFEG